MNTVLSGLKMNECFLSASITFEFQKKNRSILCRTRSIITNND